MESAPTVDTFDDRGLKFCFVVDKGLLILIRVRGYRLSIQVGQDGVEIDRL
jgi:hypothetical protein